VSTLRAYLGTAGLIDVGLRFYLQNTAQGARISTSIVDEGEGWYSRSGLTLAGDHVRWDSTGTPDAAAREDLAVRIALEAIQAGTGPTAADIADAVWDEAIADHLATGTTGKTLNSAGEAGDPWATDLPGSYTDDQAGAIIGRFNIAPASSPLVVVPGAPTDLSLCRVYGYLETLDNKPATDVTVTFQLIKQPAKSERIIVGPKISVKTDSQGRIANDAGNPWIDLQRNDNLTPAGSKYIVNCSAAGLSKVDMTLAADTFDLASLIS